LTITQFTKFSDLSRTMKDTAIFVWVIIGILIIFGFQTDSLAYTVKEDRESSELFKMLSDIIDVFDKKYYQSVSSKKMLKEAINGMINSTDPYSYLLPPEAFPDEIILGNRGYGAINLSTVVLNGYITIISPIQGTNAYKSNIRTRDKIVMVDGKPIKEVWDFHSKIRGNIGTPVILTIDRNNMKNTMNVTIIRDNIPFNNVRELILEPGYCYIRITPLQDNTAEYLKKSLEKHEKKGALKGLILDLRNNSEGLLDQAINISDFFLDDGTIVSIACRNKKEEMIFRANPDKMQRNYPIVVLINEGTAKEAEIIAGALQDNKRAIILGINSFGYGTIQNVQRLNSGYGINFTIAQYITPSGREIEKNGIIPDVLVDMPLEIDNDIKSDGLIQIALEILKKTPSSQFEDVLLTAKKIIANRVH